MPTPQRVMYTIAATIIPLALVLGVSQLAGADRGAADVDREPTGQVTVRPTPSATSTTVEAPDDAEPPEQDQGSEWDQQDKQDEESEEKAAKEREKAEKRAAEEAKALERAQEKALQKAAEEAAKQAGGWDD